MRLNYAGNIIELLLWNINSNSIRMLFILNISFFYQRLLFLIIMMAVLLTPFFPQSLILFDNFVAAPTNCNDWNTLYDDKSKQYCRSTIFNCGYSLSFYVLLARTSVAWAATFCFCLNKINYFGKKWGQRFYLDVWILNDVAKN